MESIIEIKPEFKKERISLYDRVGAIKPKKQSEYIYENGLIVENRTRFLKSQNQIDNIIAYDTETYKGTCRLLARSDGRTKFIYKPTFDEALDFLFFKANESHTWRFFFNIDFDISSIMKLWRNVSQIDKLIHGNTIQYKKYSMSWIKGRMFILRKGKRSVKFTDLFNMFHSSLQEASNKYLKNQSKDDIDGNKLNTSLNYWSRNLERIIDYCIKDCVITKNLGLILLEHLIKAKVELPKYLASSASLSKQDFRYNCYIPNISHIPQEIQEIAFKTYFGGRFEAIKRGSIGKAYLYDINSQYPTFMRELPSLKYGMWFPINHLPEKPCIAYFLATLIIPDENILSTIPVKHKGVVKFPNGFIRKWLTWYDLDLMREYITKIEKGYIYKESKFEYKPLRERIDFHYSEKARWKGKNDLMYMIHKLTMNALYGCCVETHDNMIDEVKEWKAGILFNPVYASQITAFGRWSVLKDVWNERESVLAIHTDSLLTDKEMDIPLGTEIGLWSLEGSGKSYLINTGMYQVNSKKPIIKRRGIPKKYIKDWFTFAKANKALDSKEFIVKRMLKISQALIQEKSVETVNTMVDTPKSVNVNSDRKRNWFRKFKDFNDTLKSSISSLPYIAIMDLDELELHPNPLAC